MIYRLYTGEDGQSHMEENYKPPQQVENGPGLTWRHHESGNFIDWHIAPRKQYLITLSGQVEIGLGDGTVYTLGAGDAMLAEDLTGQGHTTKAVGPEPRISLAIPVE